MLASLALALVAAAQNVIPVNGGNALTLPAARHLVRLDPGDGSPATWLLAVQQDGANGHWLSLYRSTDEAKTWTWYAPIQDACCERDTPDLIASGMDVAIVYSYEAPGVSGSTSHDVWFQWWRWSGGSEWTPQKAIRVFDSTSSSTAYLRAELARDSIGRVWVWAQRLNADGTFTMVIAVSADGGATFQTQPALDSFPNRPGGRIQRIPGGLMLLYSTHGGAAGYMRLRSDTDPVSSWGARQVVFPEGIYHGAALSAADDGRGGIHLVYKDMNEQLWYRHWSGSWSGRTLVESVADWALQPAITRIGGTLVIFWNRMVSENTAYEFRYRTFDGSTMSASTLLDGSGGFKGYPAAVESLPSGIRVPCFYGNTRDANTGGSVALTSAPSPGGSAPPPPPPPDAGVPDAGTPDAGTPDAGTPDGGSPPPPGSSIFFDDFNRTVSSSLGAGWETTAGAWRDDGRANSNSHPLNRAIVSGVSCADCRIDAKMVNFAAAESMLELRVSGADRYALALLADGTLEIRRTRAGVTSVLGRAPSGLADLKVWHSFTFAVQGAGPVVLTASVEGVPKLTATDGSSSALGSPAGAGIAATVAGVLFDDFTLTALGDSSPPPPPVDGGTPDGGVPDGGVPDAGAPDAGTPDGGSPPPGSPIFFDDFNRTVSSSLGAGWETTAGAWRDDGRANSNSHPLNRAIVSGVSCGDCRIDAKMVNFAAAESMLELRVSGADRYALALLADGTLEIRRYRAGVVSVLGRAPSGLADLKVWHSFTFAVQGAGPVVLTASVEGVPELTATDGSSSALGSPAGAGIAATVAGVLFDDFTLSP